MAIISKDQLKDLTKDFFTHVTIGQQLINAFKLNNFKYIWIQKIIDSSISIYVITVDSRRPTTYLSLSRVKKLDSTILKRSKKYGKNKTAIKEPKFSIPIPLRHFDRKIPSGSIIIRRDLGGEYFMKRGMYEETNTILTVFDEII